MKGAGRLDSSACALFPLRYSSTRISPLISLSLFSLFCCAVRNWLSAESVLSMQFYCKGLLAIILGVSDWDLKSVFASREEQWNIILPESWFASYSFGVLQYSLYELESGGVNHCTNTVPLRIAVWALRMLSLNCFSLRLKRDLMWEFISKTFQLMS